MTVALLRSLPGTNPCLLSERVEALQERPGGEGRPVASPLNPSPPAPAPRLSRERPAHGYVPSCRSPFHHRPEHLKEHPQHRPLPGSQAQGLGTSLLLVLFPRELPVALLETTQENALTAVFHIALCRSFPRQSSCLSHLQKRAPLILPPPQACSAFLLLLLAASHLLLTDDGR